MGRNQEVQRERGASSFGATGRGFFAENLATRSDEGEGGLYILGALGTIEIVLFVGIALVRG